MKPNNTGHKARGGSALRGPTVMEPIAEFPKALGNQTAAPKTIPQKSRI